MVRKLVLLVLVSALLAGLLVTPLGGPATPVASQTLGNKVYLPLILNGYRPFTQTIVSENFEGAFPGPWDVRDLSTADGGDFRWGKSSCRFLNGTASGWVIGGSGLQSCGASYPNNAYTWMIYGPFSLVGATAGWIEADVWHNFPDDNDRVSFFVSVDNDLYSGFRTQPRSSNGWQHVEIAMGDINIPNVGTVLGKPNVWVAFRFLSDSASTASEGAYLDNIVVSKQVPPLGVTSVGPGSTARSVIGLVPDSAIRTAPRR